MVKRMKHYKPTPNSIFHTAYCMAYGMAWAYGKVIGDALDWFGKKLVHLIDHSDFFAGCVVTAAVISLWELLTK